MTTPANTDGLMKIGQLKKPYGIKGWLWVFSEMDNREAIFDLQPWWIKTAMGMKPLTVVNWRKQGAGLVAQFQEIPDRNLAETMNGVPIWVADDSLPEPEADEYYWSDLVSMQVFNEQGDYLGDITKLFETGAHAIMVVAPTIDSIDAEERLIPWHKQTIVTVDTEKNQMTVVWERDY